MREQQKYLDENIQASLDEAINIMEQSLNAVRMKMYGDFGDHSAVSTTALKVGLMFRSSHFSFFVFGHFWQRRYKNLKMLRNLYLHFAR